jgi:hypothetical protein
MFPNLLSLVMFSLLIPFYFAFFATGFAAFLAASGDVAFTGVAASLFSSGAFSSPVKGAGGGSFSYDSPSGRGGKRKRTKNSHNSSEQRTGGKQLYTAYRATVHPTYTTYAVSTCQLHEYRNTEILVHGYRPH